MWPADRVERLPVDSLVAHPKNARTHTDEQVDQVAASIREWGWTVPVLVDEHNVIIAGHCRVEAAKRLGLTEVPVVRAEGWTDEQKRAYVLADNKLALNAGWDHELLKLELGELREIGADLFAAGFTEEELDEILYEKPKIREAEQVLRPKRFIRAIVSIPIESADQAKPIMDQLAEIDGAIVDYGAN